MYYLRTRPKADAIQFTVDKAAIQANQPQAAASPVAPAAVEDEEGCLSCGA
jgi:ribonucleoside-diphosphate reductase subunit M1